MKKGQIIWALVLIGIAALIIGGGLGLLPTLTFKMSLSILFGAVALISLWHIEFFGLFFSLAVLGILYAPQLHIEAITPFPLLLAALLLTIAFYLLFGKWTAKRKAKRTAKHSDWAKQHCTSNQYQNVKGEHVYDTSFGENVEQVTGELLMFKNTFGATSKYVSTDNFKSATLENSFGELKVYFDNAMMQGAEATITVNNSFGETEIFIPRTWAVDNQINVMLGEVSEKSQNQPDGRHTILLTGSVSLGELQIIYC